jgi:hypothetical protein
MNRMLSGLTDNMVVFDNTIFRRFLVLVGYASSTAEGMNGGCGGLGAGM